MLLKQKLSVNFVQADIGSTPTAVVSRKDVKELMVKNTLQQARGCAATDAKISSPFKPTQVAAVFSLASQNSPPTRRPITRAGRIVILTCA